MSEFGFEVSLCAHLEATRDGIIARQLGGGVETPGGRILDTVLVARGEQFEERVGIKHATIPQEAIEAAVGPGQFRRIATAFEDLDLHPERQAAVIDQAVEAGFFERRRRNGQEQIRQVHRYPENWYGPITAIENKPDLGRPGDLETQLRFDVGLGLVDYAILATESYITGAHKHRVPSPVGIWRYDPGGEITVVREPEQLKTDQVGYELRNHRPGGADLTFVTPAAKQHARRQIAERAYGKGWRTFDYPGCAHCEPIERHERDGLPFCLKHDRIVDPGAECTAECPWFTVDERPAIDLDEERLQHTVLSKSDGPTSRRQGGLTEF